MRNLIPHLVLEQFRQDIDRGSFPAATLFVDISGFTPLTETLMQHRKDGAEVLSEALEAIFVPLVREVYARGGLIPLFAGDAFTALFPHDPVATPDAPLHALQTAFFIQAFFAPKGRDRIFPTKYGDFAIGVRVGLSYGWVRWGIPGREGRFSFYFRGAAVSGCTQAEQQAAKGQIVADEQILPFIREQVTAQAVAGTACRQLIACSLDLAAPGVSLPPLSRADLSPFVPEAVLDLTVKAEFREACPLFLSFEEPEEAARLHPFLGSVLELAAAYGGNLGQIEFGDKGGMLVLWFGAPLSHENDVACAAEFLLACRQQNWPLRWRAGQAFGVAWAGIRGGVERCEYGLIGDVVNLASRLAMRAGWGEMWVSPAAYERLKGTYRLETRRAVQLKGKRGRIPVYHLLGRQERVEAAFYSGRMVGREAEMEQLRAHVQPILAGCFAGLVYVHGEAGVGKSRLVYELRQRLASEGVRWFLCPADQILRQSLNPFRRFLRRYFDQSRERAAEQNRARFEAVLDDLIAGLQATAAPPGIDTAELAGELERTRSVLGALVDLHWAGSLYEQLDPKLRLENTLAAFKTLILAESLRQPVVLQVEDLHWLDADSPALIQLLTRNMAAYPFAVICTSRYRDDGSRVTLAVDRQAPQQGVELGMLAPEGVRALAAQMLNGEIAPELAAFLVDKTGGNPFFVEQLVLHLRERDVLTRVAGGPWSARGEVGVLELPTTINAVLIARLDRLLAQVKEVVQTAAVLGREFEVQVLSQMLRGEEGVPARVKEAEAERIWMALSEVRYLFRHALLRDAAYDMQLRARLRELHHLAGEAIEQVYAADLASHYADLAYHYGRAEEMSQEQHYARLAGEQAAARFANAEAVAHLSRALELMPEEGSPQDAAARGRLLLARERVYDLLGDRQAQARDLVTLEALAASRADLHLQAEAALRRASYAEVTGDWPGASLAAQNAIHLAQAGGDVGMEAVGYRQWGRILRSQGDLVAARAQLETALALARSASLRTLEAEGLRDLGVASWQQGDPAQAEVCFEQSLRLCQETGDRRAAASALNNLGNAARLQADHERASDYLHHALSVRREIGDRWGQASTLANLGLFHNSQGDYSAAQTQLRQGLRICREILDRHCERTILQGLGVLWRRLGDYAAARTYLEQDLRISAEIGDRLGEGEALAELGLVLHLQGDDDAALQTLQEARHILEEHGTRSYQPYGLIDLGHVLTSLGRLDEAAAIYRQAMDLRRALGQECLVIENLSGLAAVILAQGHTSQALAHVEEILAYLETHTLDAADVPSRVYMTCYRVLQANGDPRAETILTTAYRLLQERAARIEEEALRRSFLENVAVHREIVAAYRARLGAL